MSEQERYAFVELMGHRQRVGRVSEVSQFGGVFCRVEPLQRDGTLGPAEDYGCSAIYAISWCEKETALQYVAPGGLCAALPEHPADEPGDEPEDKDEDDGLLW